MSAQVLVLHDPETGRWYYLPPSVRGTLFADGFAATRLNSRWWFTDAEATVLEDRYDGLTYLGYQLRDGIPPSEQYPEALTVEDFRARVGDSETAPESALYERVTEPKTTVTVIDAERVRLDGAPVPDDGLTWIAELPFELRYHSEFLHLFPGYLPHFRAALASRLNTLPGVSAYDQASFSVYANVRDPRPPKSRRKADQRKGLTIKHEFSRPVPYRIDGASRAEAKAAWERLLDEFASEVDSVGAVKCETCDGAGYHKVSAIGAREGRTV